jgi:hypothetical protein
VILVLVGFGIGYLVLRAGGALYRGSGSGARTSVGILALAAGVMTGIEVRAVSVGHNQFQGGMFPGLVELLLAFVIGTVGAGLFFAFLLSFRTPPMEG